MVTSREKDLSNTFSVLVREHYSLQSKVSAIHVNFIAFFYFYFILLFFWLYLVKANLVQTGAWHPLLFLSKKVLLVQMWQT